MQNMTATQLVSLAAKTIACAEWFAQAGSDPLRSCWPSWTGYYWERWSYQNRWYNFPPATGSQACNVGSNQRKPVIWRTLQILCPSTLYSWSVPSWGRALNRTLKCQHRFYLNHPETVPWDCLYTC